jgi:branched-chain amino acid transport system permease protein
MRLLRTLPVLLRELAPLVLLLVALVALSSLSPVSLDRTVTDWLIKLVVVVGLFIFIGNTGVISFGHMSFMAIGAYVSAWLTISPMMKKLRLHDLPEFLQMAEMNVVVAGLLAGCAGAVAAFIVGLPLLRLTGISASIGTFAVLIVTTSIAGNWDGLTGGRGSLIGLPVYVTPWVALAWAVGALVIAWAFTRSRIGLMVRAARGDEVAARASGVNIYRQRLIALVVSGFVMGVGGSLYGHFLGILSANAFFLDLTFITLAMLVVGGMETLSGAVIGTLLVSLLLEVLRRFEGGFSIAGVSVGEMPGLAEVGLAIVMLCVLILRPPGLRAGRDLTFRRANPPAAPKSSPKPAG